MISRELLCAIVDQYRGRLDGVHGVDHWARVLDNGVRLAELEGADRRVVALFAVFHDACRVNESIDPGHGARGADLARRLRGVHFDLDDDAMALLVDACERHTDGEVVAPRTVQVCWDADRLDLLRCGIVPRRSRLATASASEADLLAWACGRAEARVVTDLLASTWRRWLVDGAPA